MSFYTYFCCIADWIKRHTIQSYCCVVEDVTPPHVHLQPLKRAEHAVYACSPAPRSSDQHGAALRSLHEAATP